MNTSMQSNLPYRILALVFIVAISTRLAVVLIFAEQDRSAWLPDEEQYWGIAESLSSGHGLRDELGFRAARMPLYPALLSVFTSFENGHLLALVFQAVCAGGAALLSAWLAVQIGHSLEMRTTLLAMLAGLIVAIDPFTTYFCRYLLTENLFITAWCAFWAISWKLLCAQQVPWHRWFLSAAVFSVCVYLRPACLAFLFPWSIVVAWQHRGALGQLACVWITVLLLLAPWAMRNHSLTGQWTWLTHRGGISLYDGVHPQADGSSNLGHIKQMDAVRGLDEVAWNNYFKNQAWHHIKHDHVRLLGLSVTKFLRTWRPWPNAPGHDTLLIKMIGGTWMFAILSLAIVAVLSRHSLSWIHKLALLMPAIYFSALHMVFVGSVRYRLPAMPMLGILAAFGFCKLLSKRAKTTA